MGEDGGPSEEGDTGSRDGRVKLFRQEHYYPGSGDRLISQNRWAASTETAGACERVRGGGVRDVGLGFLSVTLAKSHGANAGSSFETEQCYEYRWWHSLML
jgi:hypothetical protein